MQLPKVAKKDVLLIAREEYVPFDDWCFSALVVASALCPPDQSVTMSAGPSLARGVRPCLGHLSARRTPDERPIACPGLRRMARTAGTLPPAKTGADVPKTVRFYTLSRDRLASIL